MATVTFDHVTKKYGDVIAVNDLNLEIGDGEFMVLVGPSGCGKTTSLRMIAGLEEISSGTVRIGDRIVSDVPPKDREIAMVFQSYAFLPHMPVRDNLRFGLKLGKVPQAHIERRTRGGAARSSPTTRARSTSRCRRDSARRSGQHRAESSSRASDPSTSRSVRRAPRPWRFGRPPTWSNTWAMRS